MSGAQQSQSQVVKEESTSLPPPEFKHFPMEPAPVDDVSEAPSRASRFQEDFQRLQVLSPEGPPTSLTHRNERQQLAYRLSLDPIVYNLLVFGEMPPCQKNPPQYCSYELGTTLLVTTLGPFPGIRVKRAHGDLPSVIVRTTMKTLGAKLYPN